MIRWIWRRWKSMSRLQWMAMFVTMFIPTVFSLLPSPITVEPFVLPTRHPAFIVPVFGLWSLLVLVLVPAVFRQDRSNMGQVLDRKLQGPIREIKQLKDDLERTKADLDEQVAWMERATRAGFEKLGVTFSLPPDRDCGYFYCWHGEPFCRSERAVGSWSTLDDSRSTLGDTPRAPGLEKALESVLEEVLGIGSPGRLPRMACRS